MSRARTVYVFHACSSGDGCRRPARKGRDNYNNNNASTSSSSAVGQQADIGARSRSSSTNNDGDHCTATTIVVPRARTDYDRDTLLRGCCTFALGSAELLHTLATLRRAAAVCVCVCVWSLSLVFFLCAAEGHPHPPPAVTVRARRYNNNNNSNNNNNNITPTIFCRPGSCKTYFHISRLQMPALGS